MVPPTPRLLAAEVALVLVGVSAFTAAMAWPVPLHPDSWWVGTSYNDHASIAWTLDFVAERLAHGEWPWGHSTRLEWPQGGTLFPADLPEALLVAPVVLTVGASAALNLLSVLHHGLAAALTWGWLRREGSEPAGAAAGALAFAFAPALVTATFNGNPDVTPWYWVPAALWVAATPGWRRALLAGLLVAIGGWCSPYAGVVGALALAGRLAVDRRWLDLALGLGVALAGGLAVASLTGIALDAPNAAIIKGHRTGLMGTATLWGLVRPAPFVLGTDPFWDAPRVATGTYLGWSLLLAAPLARDRRTLGWLLVAVGVVAALGPELRLTDAAAHWETGRVPGSDGPPPVGGGTGIPLPWALVELLPGLGQLQLTGRYTGLAALGLAWLASRAAPRLGRWRWALPAVVAADLLVSAGGATLLRAAPAWEDGACAALEPLAPGAVADLPPTYHELWLYQSLCHGRPVAEGINRPLPDRVRVAAEREGPAALGPSLARRGYRWLVVHHQVPGPAYEDAVALFAQCRVVRNPEISVYDLSCVP